MKIRASTILTFATGALCGGMVWGLLTAAARPERLPTEFVPGTKITETKLDDRTYLYLSPYTAAETQNLPAAPLLDRMAARTREVSDQAFVMLGFNPGELCQTAAAHHAATAILMRPLSDKADEIVDAPETMTNN